MVEGNAVVVGVDLIIGGVGVGVNLGVKNVID